MPGAVAVLAAHAQRELPLSEPVGHLTEFFAESDVHRAEELFDKLRAELGMVVEKLHRLSQAGERGIERDDLPLPLWIRQLPVRFEILFLDELAVVVEL